jgi:hypothetical protein
VEYLFLTDETPKFFAEYEERLFSFFNVNEKTSLALWENVVNIFLATGRQGLAEKYGRVPETDRVSVNDAVYCTNCGKKFSLDADFCTECGEKLKKERTL